MDFLVITLGLESRAEGVSIGQTLLDKGTRGQGKEERRRMGERGEPVVGNFLIVNI